MRENSNIEDMKFLQENLFSFPAILFDTEYRGIGTKEWADTSAQKETLAKLFPSREQ